MRKLLSQYKGLSRDIYILFIGRIVQSMGSFIWPMLTLILSTKFHYDAPTIAIIILIGGALNIPAFYLGGKLSDRYSRKKVILIASYLMVAGYFINSLLPLGIHTIAIFFASAFMANITHPASTALIADKSSSKDRERAYSLGYLGFNLGFILGPSIGGFLLQNHLALAFFIDGLTSLFGTILIHIYVQEKRVGEKEIEIGEYETAQNHISVFEFFKNNKVIIFYLVFIALSEVMYIQVNFLLPLQLEALMNSYAEFYGLLSSFNGLVVILFTPLLTLILRKVLSIDRFIIATLLYMSSFLLYALLYDYWFIFVLGMFLFTLGEIVGAITRGAYISQRVPSSHRGRIEASISILTSLLIGVGQFSFSRTLLFIDYNRAWFIIFGIGILILIILPFFKHLDKVKFPKFYL